MPQITPLQRVLVAAAGSAAERAESLFALDAECAHIARVANEPIMAQIRLAWWRDGLNSLAGLAEHRSPLMDSLRAFDAFEVMRPHLVAMIDGWEELILFDGTDPDAMLSAYAKGRGGGFFAAFESGADEHAGQLWALWDLAGNVSDKDLAAGAIAMACEIVKGSRPRLPRMLAMMAAVAAHDIGRGRGAPSSLTPGLYLRLLRAQIFGR